MDKQKESAIRDQIATCEQYPIGKPESKASPLNPLAYDTTFAGDGSLSIPHADRTIHWVSSIVRLQGNDSRYLASFYEALAFDNPDTYTNVAGLVCFDSRGAIDTSFGNEGFVDIRFGASDYSMPTELIELQSGALLVAGMQIATANLVFHQSWMMARHKPDGLLDTEFANNGVFNLSEVTGMPLRTEGVVGLPDGQIVIAATATEGNRKSYLLRLHANGQLDGNFGERGIKEIKRTPGNATYVAGLKSSDRGNKLLTYGYYQGLSFNTGFIARLDSDGNVDPSFGTHGFVDVPHDQRTDVRGIFVGAQEDHLLFAGSFSNPSSGKYESLLMRYLPDGSADPTFNEGKPVHLSFHETSINDSWRDARTLQGKEGKILVLGQGFQDPQDPQDPWPAAGRFDSRGKLDASFAEGAGIGSPVGASFFGRGKHIDEPGRLICAGAFNGTAAVFALKV